jgi:hypothetical protein
MLAKRNVMLVLQGLVSNIKLGQAVYLACLVNFRQALVQRYAIYVQPTHSRQVLVPFCASPALLVKRQSLAVLNVQNVMPEKLEQEQMVLARSVLLADIARVRRVPRVVMLVHEEDTNRKQGLPAVFLAFRDFTWMCWVLHVAKRVKKIHIRSR